MLRSPAIVGVLLASLAGCGAPASGDPGDAATALPEPARNQARDLLSTDLHFDVEARSGTALVTLDGDGSNAASLSVGDLRLLSVQSEGRELHVFRDESRLDIGVPDTGAPVTLRIEFEFEAKDGFEGFRELGSTLTWPAFCGNLFPCTVDPADGASYTLSVEGVPRGQSAVYPQAIPGQAPSYAVAFALGTYAHLERGQTSAGTKVGAYYLPGGQAQAEAGTEYLRDYVEFFEQTYGAYSFGDTIAAVAVNWGAGAAGGIEHHPYFHVAASAMGSHEVQAHEAAHGWFGNGVRIACWEDFVLSEGVAQYLTARAIEAAEGASAGDAMWAIIESRLGSAVASGDTAAYPEGCNQIDILTDPLWSRIPYEKGALFLRAVEDLVGRSQLDASLASFYGDNVGNARHMSDLLDAIASDTGVDIEDLSQAWLRGLGIPD